MRQCAPAKTVDVKQPSAKAPVRRVIPFGWPPTGGLGLGFLAPAMSVETVSGSVPVVWILQGPGLHQLEESGRASGHQRHQPLQAGPLDLAGLRGAFPGVGGASRLAITSPLFGVGSCLHQDSHQSENRHRVLLRPARTFPSHAAVRVELAATFLNPC